MAANDDERRTVWCGNLSEKVNQKLLHELFLQAGPLERVNIPKEKDGRQKNYGFIVYVHEESVPYALELFRGTSLYQKTLNLQNKGNSRPLKVSSCDIIARDIPPELNSLRFVQGCKPMSQRLGPVAQPEYSESLLSSTNVYVKDLSVASLQGSWSSRAQFSNHDRGNNRYNPYRQNKRHERDYRRQGEERDQSDHSQYRNYRENHRNYRNYKY